MVVDVRRGLSLGSGESPLVFVSPPEPAYPSRQLMLSGTPVFELGMWCGTCPAVFQKLSEPTAGDVLTTHQRLNTGLRSIDHEVLRTYGALLPDAQYTVLLLEVAPRLVVPGGPADYFSHEQVATWGITSHTNAPEDPRTPYYRTVDGLVAPEQHLYEFVVPMVPPAWNDRGRVEQYQDSTGIASATAVAYSLLDVVQPAMDGGENYDQHWVLSHFLLDGHHKMEAAAATGTSIRLLSFIDEKASLASAEDIATLVDARRQVQP